MLVIFLGLTLYVYSCRMLGSRGQFMLGLVAGVFTCMLVIQLTKIHYTPTAISSQVDNLILRQALGE